MSNEKHQTAVESLKEFFKQYDLANSSLDYYEFKIPMRIFDKKFQEAKELEKEQIKNAWGNERQVVFFDSFQDTLSEDTIKDLAEHYYNETYGNPSTP